MTKKPKPKAANWAAYTKSESVQACNTLSAQKTKLLNKIAKLEAQLAPAPQREPLPVPVTEHDALPNPFSAVEEALLAGALGVVHVRQDDLCVGEDCPQHGTPHVRTFDCVQPGKMPWET